MEVPIDTAWHTSIPMQSVNIMYICFPAERPTRAFSEGGDPACLQTAGYLWISQV
jgi:hypothetical protein